MNLYKALKVLIKEVKIDYAKLSTLVKSSKSGLNAYRHEATNYDTVWRKAYKLVAAKDVSTVIHKLQNAVNEAIVVFVEKVCRESSNIIRFPSKTQDAWTVQYVKSGMTVDKAELLAASKVENAKLRAKGAAAKAARKARLLKVV